MFKLRSAQRRMAIDDTRYEKRVDHKPRAGRPHSRIILTEVEKPSQSSQIFTSKISFNEDRSKSTVVRNSLKECDHQGAMDLLLAIVLPEYRLRCKNYRYMLVRYDGKRMLPVPGIYNPREDKIDEEVREAAAKHILSFIRKALNLYVPCIIYEDEKVRIKTDGSHLEVRLVARNGAVVLTRYDLDGGLLNKKRVSLPAQ